MLVLGWVTAWEYMVLQAFFGLFLAFFGHRLFLQTPAKKITIILDILSRKKIWPPGGLEPGTFGLGDRRLICLATQA